MATPRDRYDLFVFDLDGTLADTREDIASSVSNAFCSLGLEPVPIDVVTRHVGDGARKLLARCLGEPASEEMVDRALAAFLDNYRVECTRRTRLYPGVLEALEALQPTPLAVLTNKPHFHSTKILEALKVARFFGAVIGGDSLPRKKPDPAGLEWILERFGCARERAVLVGDSKVDMETARAAGTASAFVTYGFQPDAGRDHPPDHVLGSLLDLVRS
ncbi:MAG TPA: HAD-IA family hydrolase [Planctomycetota bacterium]|nr:HAD-IA family hydrolase [Planctomycetota bacterium]